MASTPITLTADASGVLQRIEDIPAAIEERIQSRLTFLTGEVADQVRDNLSGGVLNTRSGMLLGSVQRYGPSSVSGGLEAGVTAGGPDASYGIYHEEGGRGPYPITAVKANALAFEMNGKLVMVRSVMHPSIIKRPWFGPAVDKVAPTVEPDLQGAINEAVSE